MREDPTSPRSSSGPARLRPLEILSLCCGVVLTADAAVESWPHAGVRWWAVGAAVVYAAVAGLSWRRGVSWKVNLLAALATLLGAVAITAWVPGGTSDGIRLFTLSTPRVLALVVAAGVVLAGLAVTQLARVPVAARAAVAALALYGTAAYVLAAIGGVSIAALLSGASLWQRLPALLQGAAIGAAVVLPLGIVALVVSAGLRRPDGNSPGAQAAKAVVIVTSAAIVLASAPFRTGTSTAYATAPGAPVPSPSEVAASALHDMPRLSTPELTASLDNSFRAIADGERWAPRDRWDVAALAARLGADPMTTFRWVRSHTVWVPYRGLLRGATGVLMDRRGDSLDRAELLGMLLRSESRRGVRLAHASLSRDQVKLIFRVLFQAGASNRPAAAGSGPDAWGPIAAAYHFDETSLRSRFSSQAAGQDRLREELRKRASADARRLVGVIGPRAGARGDAIREAISALQDHWWVQLQDNQTWRDLDLLGDAEGHALAAADRTEDPEDIPVGDRQQLVVRVIAEQWTAGSVRERVALEQTLRPYDLIGVPVALQFVPNQFPQQFPPPNVNPGQGLRAVALAQQEWTPLLQVGPKPIVQTAVTSAGDLTMPGGVSDPIKMAQGVAKGLGPALDGLFAPEPSSPPSTGAPAPQGGPFLTATWIEYEIQVPGEPGPKIRREVFDALGPAARGRGVIPAPILDEPARLHRSLALMMTTEILPAVCDLAPEFVQHLTAKGILSNRDPLLKALRGDVPDDYEHAQEFAQGVAPMPGPLYAVALARFAWSPVAAHVFVNRPNILTRHSYFEPTASGFALRQATDIVSNDVGVTLAGYDPFRVRLLQGVFDTNVEARIESSQPDATNPAWAFDGGGNWIGVKSPQDPQLSAIQLGGDIVSRMTSDLRTGYAVVAPSSPLAVGPGRFEGWWQIDQRTGRTLGIGPNGWGPTMAERIILWGEIAAVGFLSSYVLCKIQGGDKGDRGPGAFADPEPSGQPWLDALSPPLYARRLNPCITEGLISALQSTLFAFLDGLKWPGGGGGGPSPSGEPGGGGPGGGGPGGGGPGGGGPGGGGPGGGGPGGGGGEPGGGEPGGGGGGGGGPQGGGGGNGSQGGGSRGGGLPGLGEDGFPRDWNEAMKQGWREMDQATARSDQQAADQAFRRVIAADDRPGGQKYPVGWQQDVTEPGGGGWGDTSEPTGGSNSNGDPNMGSGSGSGNGSPNNSSNSLPSDPNNVDPLAKTQGQDLVMGATCPVPCASPLATSQAGLGNMTQLLGKH